MLSTASIELSRTTDRGTVLVADDDLTALEIVTTALAQAGWRTRTAANGLEVVKIAMTEKVDALILDVRMPMLDGYEVCLDLCRRGRNLPILVMSGCIGDTELLEFLNVKQTVRKPVNPGELLNFVESISQSPAHTSGPC